MKIILSIWLVIFPLICNALPITAKSWLVADNEGNVIQSENINEIRSIASITKLMTVMVVLDAHQDLDQYIKPYTRLELIQLALVKSDNNATQLLCKHYPGGNVECVKAMNIKAHFLNMPNTKCVEPTGLSVFNVSTATELIKLVLARANIFCINNNLYLIVSKLVC